MFHLHNIFSSVWMIEDSYAANYIPTLTAFLKGDLTKENTDKKEYQSLNIHTLNSSSSSPSNNGGSGMSSGLIAIVTVSGVITKHDQFCGPDGMTTISSILEECYANEDISGIVLKVESGGGEGMAMRLLNETIAKHNKPLVAFIDDMACSAAYGIVSGCDVIVANSPMAQVGSIGTYMTVADYQQYFEKEGIKLMDIYATASTDKNKPVREALKGNTDLIKELADSFNDYFLNLVETNRGDKLTTERKEWGTGKVFFAEKAKEIGLIDEIDSFSNILNYFVQ